MVLDALASHVAVVDGDGRIVATNHAWKRFAKENGCTGGVDAGANYFSACSATGPGRDAEEAARAEAGIRDVLDGRSDLFEMEYPCHAAGVERWFVMRVTPMLVDGQRLTVVMHTNVTRLRAEREMAEQIRESSSVSRLSNAGGHFTLSAMGLASLRDSEPALFEKLADDYAGALRRAVQRRIHAVPAPGASGELKRLAETMMELRVGPRDAVDVHLRGIRMCIESLTASQAQIFAEEGRLALLELMGDLVAAYRRTSVAVSAGERESR